jgi:predicted transposase YdaD
LSSADILFETKFEGKTGYLYLLLEHQSTSDRLMPFRVLNYMVRIMQQHIEVYKTKLLPIVYPMIFATTKRLYKGPRDIFQLFGEQEKLARSILFKPFQLVDVNTVSEEELKEHLWSGAMMYAMKHIYDKNVVKGPLQAGFRRAITRKKWLKKRSLHVVNEHFEAIFDKVSAPSIQRTNASKI